jgi:hypothetical protein
VCIRASVGRQQFGFLNILNFSWIKNCSSLALNYTHQNTNTNVVEYNTVLQDLNVPASPEVATIVGNINGTMTPVGNSRIVQQKLTRPLHCSNMTFRGYYSTQAGEVSFDRRPDLVERAAATIGERRANETGSFQL